MYSVVIEVSSVFRMAIFNGNRLEAFYDWDYCELLFALVRQKLANLDIAKICFVIHGVPGKQYANVTECETPYGVLYANTMDLNTLYMFGHSLGANEVVSIDKACVLKEMVRPAELVVDVTPFQVVEIVSSDRISLCDNDLLGAYLKSGISIRWADDIAVAVNVYAPEEVYTVATQMYWCLRYNGASYLTSDLQFETLQGEVKLWLDTEVMDVPVGDADKLIEDLDKARQSAVSTHAEQIAVDFTLFMQNDIFKREATEGVLPDEGKLESTAELDNAEQVKSNLASAVDEVERTPEGGAEILDDEMVQFLVASCTVDTVSVEETLEHVDAEVVTAVTDTELDQAFDTIQKDAALDTLALAGKYPEARVTAIPESYVASTVSPYADAISVFDYTMKTEQKFNETMADIKEKQRLEEENAALIAEEVKKTELFVSTDQLVDMFIGKSQVTEEDKEVAEVTMEKINIDPAQLTDMLHEITKDSLDIDFTWGDLIAEEGYLGNVTLPPVGDESMRIRKHVRVADRPPEMKKVSALEKVATFVTEHRKDTDALALEDKQEDSVIDSSIVEGQTTATEEAEPKVAQIEDSLAVPEDPTVEAGSTSEEPSETTSEASAVTMAEDKQLTQKEKWNIESRKRREREEYPERRTSTKRFRRKHAEDIEVISLEESKAPRKDVRDIVKSAVERVKQIGKQPEVIDMPESSESARSKKTKKHSEQRVRSTGATIALVSSFVLGLAIAMSSNLPQINANLSNASYVAGVKTGRLRYVSQTVYNHTTENVIALVRLISDLDGTGYNSITMNVDGVTVAVYCTNSDYIWARETITRALAQKEYDYEITDNDNVTVGDSTYRSFNVFIPFSGGDI